MQEVKSESEVAQSCLILRDPMDYSLPGFSIHGIFQARVLEWGVIAFSIYGNKNINILPFSIFLLKGQCILHMFTKETCGF